MSAPGMNSPAARPPPPLSLPGGDAAAPSIPTTPKTPSPGKDAQAIDQRVFPVLQSGSKALSEPGTPLSPSRTQLGDPKSKAAQAPAAGKGYRDAVALYNKTFPVVSDVDNVPKLIDSLVESVSDLENNQGEATDFKFVRDKMDFVTHVIANMRQSLDPDATSGDAFEAMAKEFDQKMTELDGRINALEQQQEDDSESDSSDSSSLRSITIDPDMVALKKAKELEGQPAQVVVVGGAFPDDENLDYVESSFPPGDAVAYPPDLASPPAVPAPAAPTPAAPPPPPAQSIARQHTVVCLMQPASEWGVRWAKVKPILLVVAAIGLVGGGAILIGGNPVINFGQTLVSSPFTPSLHLFSQFMNQGVAITAVVVGGVASVGFIGGMYAMEMRETPLQTLIKRFKKFVLGKKREDVTHVHYLIAKLNQLEASFKRWDRLVNELLKQARASETPVVLTQENIDELKDIRDRIVENFTAFSSITEGQRTGLIEKAFEFAKARKEFIDKVVNQL